MDSAIATTEPRSLWSHFATILTLPRPSKHEERIAGWIRDWSTQHGFECATDATGNLVVRVPGSPGHEKAPTVILQSHLDMVCEKNGETGHDFHKDPIPATIEGDWVITEGTTLGADNGIGVAASMAAAVDESVVHGPLELLFTVDEETGLTGAAGLDGSLLTGRLLLNLDSEDEGILFVGCAGGADTQMQSGAERVAPADDAVTITVDVRGLRGGHSGMDIDDNRGNAIVLLARSLRRLDEEGFSWGLHIFRGRRPDQCDPQGGLCRNRRFPGGSRGCHTVH